MQGLSARYSAIFGAGTPLEAEADPSEDWGPGRCEADGLEASARWGRLARAAFARRAWQPPGVLWSGAMNKNP